MRFKKIDINNRKRPKSPIPTSFQGFLWGAENTEKQNQKQPKTNAKKRRKKPKKKQKANH